MQRTHLFHAHINPLTANPHVLPQGPFPGTRTAILAIVVFPAEKVCLVGRAALTDDCDVGAIWVERHVHDVVWELVRKDWRFGR